MTGQMKKITEKAILDFEEYNDVGIVSTVGKQHFREQYEISKQVSWHKSMLQNHARRTWNLWTLRIAEEEMKLTNVVKILAIISAAAAAIPILRRNL
jgi:hypothetical protein